jgi:hypothetical protein
MSPAFFSILLSHYDCLRVSNKSGGEAGSMSRTEMFQVWYLLPRNLGKTV